MSPWSRLGIDRAVYTHAPLGVRIAICASPYLAWGYDRDRPAVAYPSGSVPGSLVGRGQVTNCSTLTASVLMAAYPDAHWTSREYADLQVFADRFELGADYHPRGDSPMAAIERVGVGHVTRQFWPGSWHLVQGWRGDKPPAGGGHAFLVYAEDEQLQVLEASPGVGPRWRRATVQELESRYEILHIARLAD